MDALQENLDGEAKKEKQALCRRHCNGIDHVIFVNHCVAMLLLMLVISGFYVHRRDYQGAINYTKFKLNLMGVKCDHPDFYAECADMRRIIDQQYSLPTVFEMIGHAKSQLAHIIDIEVYALPIIAYVVAINSLYEQFRWPALALCLFMALILKTYGHLTSILIAITEAFTTSLKITVFFAVLFGVFCFCNRRVNFERKE